MKKYLWIFIFLILIIGAGMLFFVRNDNNKQDDYSAERMTTNVNNNSNKAEDVENSTANKETETQEIKVEEEIAEFSTNLPKDTKERYSNIKLACETIDGTVIKSGETFSLWEVLGCPTKEKGYEKAKAFTSDGEIKKSYGGGICQVSTTIYNAVLETEGLEIKERHAHSRDVTYIEDGKDAAVSYDTADLKFKNTLEYDVKIQATVKNNKVKIELIRI